MPFKRITCALVVLAQAVTFRHLHFSKGLPTETKYRASIPLKVTITCFLRNICSMYLSESHCSMDQDMNHQSYPNLLPPKLMFPFPKDLCPNSFWKVTVTVTQSIYFLNFICNFVSKNGMHTGKRTFLPNPQGLSIDTATLGERPVGEQPLKTSRVSMFLSSFRVFLTSRESSYTPYTPLPPSCWP